MHKVTGFVLGTISVVMEALQTAALLVCLLVQQAQGESGSAYHGPPPIKEVFNYNDRSYFLYSERVSWDEAYAICKSNDGNLAAPDDSAKAAFIAQSIAEAWAPFEDMWIGGQKSTRGWQWTAVGKVIPVHTRQDANYTFVYPPWVDDVAPNRFNRECLAIDRNGHSDPFFVDLECRMPRPFICENAKTVNEGDPTQARVLEIFDSEYVLYHGRLSWEGAVAFCRQNGYSLASVKNLTIAQKLAAAMLKTRPEFEDVWIGGQLKNDRWVWVADSEEMAVAEGYPPWSHPPRKGKNCVLFDRHLCDEPKFIDVKCNRVRDFVCMRNIEEEITEATVAAPVRYKHKIYSIHAGQLTWEEAKIICEDTQGGQMLELEDQEEVNFLMQAMADNKQEIDHVWLGGRLVNDDWTWVYNGSVIVQMDDAGYPPWCDNEKIPEMACLNMDRQNHLTPLMYGLECNVTQGVICIQDASDRSKRIVLDNVTVDVSYSSVTGNNLTWTQARQICRDDTGKMLTEVDAARLTDIVKELGAGHYYIGAKMTSAGRGTWDGTPTAVFELPNLPPYDPKKLCLSMNVAGDAGSSTLVALETISCNEIMDHNFICRETCEKKFDPEGADKDRWKCDWVEGTGVDERTLGKRCWHQCDHTEATIGSRKMTCTMTGWRGAHETSVLPTCKRSDTALSLVNTLLDEEAGAVFIVDNSDRVSEDDFKVFKYFIAAVMSTHKASTVPSKKLAFNVFLMSNGVVTEFTPDTDKPCDAIAVLDTDLKNEEGPSGHRDFSAALYDARNWVDKQENISVFFVAAGHNQGDAYRDNLKQLKKQVKSIIAVGVNHASDEEMTEIASVHKENVNAIAFSNTYYLRLATEKLYVPGTCDAQISNIKKAADTVHEVAVKQVRLDAVPVVQESAPAATLSVQTRTPAPAATLAPDVALPPEVAMPPEPALPPV